MSDVFFKEPRNAQSAFSSETEPTLWKAIPILECIQTNWTTFSKLDKFKPLHAAIHKGLAKLEKWYTNIKESDTYYTCLGLPFCFILDLTFTIAYYLVLHPGIKQVYCEQKWDSISFNAAKKNFEKLVCFFMKFLRLSNSFESSLIHITRLQRNLPRLIQLERHHLLEVMGQISFFRL